MALGVFVLFSPVVIGEWVISLLGLVLIAAGLFQLVQTLRAADQITSWLSYIAGSITILLGLLLFLAPNLVLSGGALPVTVLLVSRTRCVMQQKLLEASKQKGPIRPPGVWQMGFSRSPARPDVIVRLDWPRYVAAEGSSDGRQRNSLGLRLLVEELCECFCCHCRKGACRLISNSLMRVSIPIGLLPGSKRRRVEEYPRRRPAAERADVG